MEQQQAEVGDFLGRAYLRVCGVVVAFEGDTCRDSEYPERFWDKKALMRARNRINAKIRRNRKADP